LCKYGYNSLDNLKGAVERTLKAEIPLDVQYAGRPLIIFNLNVFK
jgi:maltase-glucoamylase